MLKSFVKKTLPASFRLLFVPVRTDVYAATMIQPITNKESLNSITPDDERHFMQVRPPKTTQCNSLLYNERLEYVYKRK